MRTKKEKVIVNQQPGVDLNPNPYVKKFTPRDPEMVSHLNSRLNRVIGQINGMKKMLDEHRFCQDILQQVAAAESALRAFGYEVLDEHLRNTVATKIKADKLDEVIPETLEIIRQMK